MATSMLRSISRKAAVTLPTNRTVISSGKRISSPSLMPWLMLPPTFEWDNYNKMIFSFSSLLDDKVRSFRGLNSVASELDGMEVVGSSHGWITFCSSDDLNMAMCNPLTGSEVFLPYIPEDLFPSDWRPYNNYVRKVITSCSPEDQKCRALMSFGDPHHQRLAFCCPDGVDDYWTPLTDEGKEEEDNAIPRFYQDFVYSRCNGLFYCIDQDMVFKAWDLRDLYHPMIVPIEPPYRNKENYPWPTRSKEETELKSLCTSLTSLVVSPESDDIFWVRRHILPLIAPHGSCVSSDQIPAQQQLLYKTVGFDVHKYVDDECALVYMDDSLDDLAFFIGKNHSLALPASDVPGLKPNCIYYTDVHDLMPSKLVSPPFGGHDHGIYNYEDRSFSSFYHPYVRCESTRPAPMWFTPTIKN